MLLRERHPCLWSCTSFQAGHRDREELERQLYHYQLLLDLEDMSFAFAFGFDRFDPARAARKGVRPKFGVRECFRRIRIALNEDGHGL